LEEDGPDELVVDDDGSVVGCWCHEPHEQSAFEDGIKGNESHDETGANLEDAQSAEEDPIRQPLLVVVRVGPGLDRLDGGIGRVSESDEIAEKQSSIANDERPYQQRTQPEDDVEAGHASSGFYLSEEVIELVFFVQFPLEFDQPAGHRHS